MSNIDFIIFLPQDYILIILRESNIKAGEIKILKQEIKLF